MPSLQLAHPALERSRLSTGASCRVRRMSNETAEVDGHTCQKLHQVVMDIPRDPPALFLLRRL